MDDSPEGCTYVTGVFAAEIETVSAVRGKPAESRAVLRSTSGTRFIETFGSRPEVLQP